MRLRRSRAERLADTRAWVSDLVRSGLEPPDRVRGLVVEAIASDHPRLPAEATAGEWIAAAREAWRRDAAGWEAPTDHDRLQDAFAELARRGLIVLQGCADHWSARAALDRADGARRGARQGTCRGVLWFLPTDVWHAIDAGMLEVNLWDRSGANAAAGDELLAEVLDVLAGHDLPARFDEGRIEVSAWWRRRPER